MDVRLRASPHLFVLAKQSFFERLTGARRRPSLDLRLRNSVTADLSVIKF
jgi:hypothetical protein